MQRRDSRPDERGYRVAAKFLNEKKAKRFLDQYQREGYDAFIEPLTISAPPEDARHKARREAFMPTHHGPRREITVYILKYKRSKESHLTTPRHDMVISTVAVIIGNPDDVHMAVPMVDDLIAQSDEFEAGTLEDVRDVLVNLEIIKDALPKLQRLTNKLSAIAERNRPAFSPVYAEKRPGMIDAVSGQEMPPPEEPDEDAEQDRPLDEDEGQEEDENLGPEVSGFDEPVVYQTGDPPEEGDDALDLTGYLAGVSRAKDDEDADEIAKQTLLASILKAMPSLDIPMPTVLSEKYRDALFQTFVGRQGTSIYTPWFTSTTLALICRKDILDLIETGESAVFEPLAESTKMKAIDSKGQEVEVGVNVGYTRNSPNKGNPGVEIQLRQGLRDSEMTTPEERWDYLYGDMAQGNGLVALPTKPLMAVSASSINCSPSRDCARYCYAYAGRGGVMNVVWTSEVIELLAMHDQERFVETVVKNLKHLAAKGSSQMKVTKVHWIDVHTGEYIVAKAVDHKKFLAHKKASRKAMRKKGVAEDEVEAAIRAFEADVNRYMRKKESDNGMNMPPLDLYRRLDATGILAPIQTAYTKFKLRASRVLAGKEAIRFFDKGDIEEHWVTILNALARKRIRCHVFSKRAEKLARVSGYHLRMLSADPSNFVEQLGHARKLGLKMAYVYPSTAEADRQVKQMADAGVLQLILPVASKFTSEEEEEHKRAHIRKNLVPFHRHLCPVDAASRYVKGEWRGQNPYDWHCFMCDTDVIGGQGCYFKFGTRAATRAAGPAEEASTFDEEEGEFEEPDEMEEPEQMFTGEDEEGDEDDIVEEEIDVEEDVVSAQQAEDFLFSISLEELGEIAKKMGLKPPPLTPAQVDRSELEEGIKVEGEHTENELMAMIVALHHLAEDKAYYSKLKKFEAMMSGTGKSSQKAPIVRRGPVPAPGQSKMFDNYVKSLAKQTRLPEAEVRESDPAYKYADKLGLIRAER